MSGMLRRRSCLVRNCMLTATVSMPPISHCYAVMSHDHSHAHEHTSDRRLVLALALNLLLTVVEVIAGLLSGSLALVADAVHNLSDCGSFVIALVARRIGRWPSDDLRTFGYRRAEIIGALINLTILIVISLYLIYEAVARFFFPQTIDGWIVVAVAAIALAVNAATTAVLYAMSRAQFECARGLFAQHGRFVFLARRDCGRRGDSMVRRLVDRFSDDACRGRIHDLAQLAGYSPVDSHFDGRCAERRGNCGTRCGIAIGSRRGRSASSAFVGIG